MEFDNNSWVNVLKSAHKTSLIQDGEFKNVWIMYCKIHSSSYWPNLVATDSYYLTFRQWCPARSHFLTFIGRYM